MNTYIAGNLVRVTATFVNASGTPTNPTTTTLEYRPGLGAALTTVVYPSAPLVNDSAGVFHADLDSTSSNPGFTTWTYGFFGAGAVQAVATGSFIVEQPIV